MTKYTNEKKVHALSQMGVPHNKPVAEAVTQHSCRQITCKFLNVNLMKVFLSSAQAADTI